MASMTRVALRRVCVRSYATAAPSAEAGAASTPSLARSPAVQNIETAWTSMKPNDQLNLIRALEEAQKKPWTALTLNEKKAAYFISFGPHGPRAPLLPAGSTTKTFVGVAGLVGAAFALFYFIRHNGKETPKTMNKEWQQATNERLLEQKVNPITGLSSENYKGPGMVQSQ